MTRLAVTGITGTIGLALGDLLEDEERVDEVVGIARRPFDPGDRGWTKVRAHAVDVRDAGALRALVRGCDVVVHLAFSLTGVVRDLRSLEDINVQGTRNVFAAARDGGARRFVQASSAAVYGIADHATPISESAPVRADPRHFYVEQKARLERILHEAAEEAGAPELVVLRPVGIAGPHAVVSSSRAWAKPLRTAATFAFGAGLRPPLPAPPVPMQFLHEIDAARAFLLAALDGSPGTYNIAPDDQLEGSEVLEELGFPVLPTPPRALERTLAGLAALPVPVPGWTWLHLLRAPFLLDNTAAREGLGWEPRYDSREALSATRAAWSA